MRRFSKSEMEVIDSIMYLGKQLPELPVHGCKMYKRHIDAIKKLEDRGFIYKDRNNDLQLTDLYKQSLKPQQ